MGSRRRVEAINGRITLTVFRAIIGDGDRLIAIEE